MANPFVRVGGFFGRFFGNTIGEAAAYGIGGALREPLHPLLQELTNATWEASVTSGISKPLDPGDAAAVEQQDYSATFDGETEAAKSGYAHDQFLALKFLAATAPGTAELLELWRRGKIGTNLVRAGLKKAGLMDEFVEAVMELFTGRLDPAVIATAIQRGIMRDPGFLPVAPPSGSGNVPAFPVSPLDPIDEAKAHGIDEPRLFVETALVGLPASVQQAAAAYFRGIGTLDDYHRAISEGNTRNEWRDLILDVSRQIPTAHDGIEYRLRGWTDDAGMYAQTARHGMSKTDTDLLLKVTGRPLSFHQVFIGERRGGTFDGPTGAIDPHFLKSLQESNIRPEWYNLAWAQRHSLPSAFVLRALLQGGVLTAAEGEQYFLDIGWPPALAKQVADFYGAGTTATGDKHVKKAQTQLWTTTHTSYKAQEIDDAAAHGSFNLLGIPTAAQTEILALWGHERGLIRAQLSPADVRKAYQQGDTNAATGAQWTRDEAFTALLDRGWGANDANDYLNIPYKG